MFRGAAIGLFMVMALPRAHAESQVDVLVVAAGTPHDAFSSRLVAELSAAGFSTRRIAYRDEPLDSLTRSEFASAAVRPLSSGKGVEVWLDERVNGRPMVRHHVVDERALGPDVNMVVLQTTELLRSELRGLTFAAPTSARNTSVPRSLWLLGAGVGAHKQQGAFSMFPVLRVEAGWAPAGALGAEVSLDGALKSSSLFTLEGSTKATPWIAGLGARLASSRGRVFGELGVGLQWQYWSLQGDAEGALVAHSKSVSLFGAYGRGRIGLALAAWLRLGLDLVASGNFHSTTITHAKRDVGQVDRLGVSGLLVVQASSR